MKANSKLNMLAKCVCFGVLCQVCLITEKQERAASFESDAFPHLSAEIEHGCGLQIPGSRVAFFVLSNVAMFQGA